MQKYEAEFHTAYMLSGFAAVWIDKSVVGANCR
jgi:hypothetical protein